MATTVTHYGAWGGPDNVFRLRMTITRTAVNVANNTSTVTVGVWVEARGWGSFNYNSKHVHYIDGTKVYDGMIQRSVAAPNSTQILNNTRTLTHNAAGARSVYSEASFSNPAVGNLWVGGSLTLDTIPRATQPSSGGFVTGLATTINLPRASSSFTHVVTYKIGSKSGTIATGAGASTSWVPPHDISTEFKNSPSGTVTITAVTKSGGTTIGSKSYTHSISLNPSQGPTVTDVVWTEQNATVKQAIGAFVQDISLISGDVVATGLYGSTISLREIVVGGVAVPVGTPISVGVSGSVAASGKATDSRGRTATMDKPFTVLAYQPPRLGPGGLKVSRANASNVITPLGTYLRMDLDCLVSSLKVGTTEKNAMTIAVHTRPAAGGAWVARNVINPGLTHNKAVQISGGSAYPVTSSYEVRVTISDKTGIEASTFMTVVPTATVTIDMNGALVGLGKYHERGGLDVQGSVFSSEAFEIYEGASKQTRYGAGVITTPYGTMSDVFRGTTAQRDRLASDGLAFSGMRFHDTTIGRRYVYSNYNTWVEDRETKFGTRADRLAFPVAYGDMWHETDESKEIWLGSSDGRWRLFGARVNFGVTGWMNTLAGAVWARSETYVFPSMWLEPHEEVRWSTRGSGNGYEFSELASRVSNADAETLQVVWRKAQFGSSASQPSNYYVDIMEVRARE